MEPEPLTIAESPAGAKSPSPRTMAVVAVYFGILVFAFGLAEPWSGGISTIPILFFLKKKIGMTSLQVANYGAISAIPLYLGFLFGFLRDRWRHERLGDQLYLLAASIAATAIFVYMSRIHITYWVLILGSLAGTVLFQVINSAIQAMSAIVAQRNLLTGWLSAITTLGLTLPSALSYLLGGKIAEVSPQNVFLIVAGITALIAVLAIWRPREIYQAEHAPVPQSETHWVALGRLVRHKVIWIPLIIQFLWNFAPTWGTPANYYLTDHLHFSGDDVGQFWFWASCMFLPSVLVYGALCRKVKLGTLLWVGTLLGILQGPPLLFAHTHSEAMAAGVAFGLLGGIGSAAYWDLLLRCCPKGLEGTATMLGWSLYWVANKSSDVLGAKLYDYYTHASHAMHAEGESVGFVMTIVVTTISFALIIPMLFLVPRALNEAREGEAEAVVAG